MKFMALLPLGPHRRGQVCKKRPNFQKLFSLLPHVKKTKCMIIMSLEPSTKIVKFMAPGSGVQTQGRSQYGHIVKMRNLRQSSSLTSYIFVKNKCMLVMTT